jgi:PAS domain-containing protein
MGSVQSGVVVIDGQGHVRKANRRALGLVGLAPLEGEEAAAFGALTARLPMPLLRQLREAQTARTASSGALADAEHLVEPITWVASPWGRGGMVLVLRTIGPGAVPETTSQSSTGSASAPQPDQNALVGGAMARARTLLDYVHHPCLVIQSRDASIDYANKAAREKLGLKPGLRTHINNLFEISGRHAPRHTYVTSERVTAIATLPMGARVTRMVDIDPDLLFVEYL